MKAKKISEWVVIGLLFIVIASIISITAYRTIVNSDWYGEIQTKNSFAKVVKKINDTDKIAYIKLDDNTEERFIYDIPEELFDDPSAKSYEQAEDVEQQREICSQGWVTVFYKDGTTTTFFVTDDGELYWGTSLKIDSPSLVSWYFSNIKK